MHSLRDMPIKQKMIWITLVTAGSALGLSTTAFVLQEILSARNAIYEDMSTMADIVAYNSAAAISFNDSDAAGEILAGLSAKPWIVGAFLYGGTGDRLASYVSESPGGRSTPVELRDPVFVPTEPGQVYVVRGHFAHLLHPIHMDDEQIGTIMLVNDLGQLSSVLTKYALIAFVVVIISFSVALVLALRLQRVVSDPIIGMTETMHTVAKAKDYSLRVTKSSGDEVGLLVDGFNSMLTQIQDRDAELKTYGDGLESLVTERTAELVEAKEAAEDASRIKSQFLANMSHEIRTPINGAVGMLKVLLATPLNDQQKHFVETALYSTDALTLVINDILDHSKIEAGKLELETIGFSVRELVEISAVVFGDRAASKRIGLCALVEPNVPEVLCGDMGRLRQVLLNLLGNAVKFTESGDVVLRVRVESETESDVRLRFEISDTGIGIAPDVKKKLFQPFSQADNSTTRKFGGTGLGLVISKELVTLMGGEIDVDSTPGKGSTFIFYVQLARPGIPVEAHDLPFGSVEGVRVMVVGGDALDKELLENLLEAWRCNAVIASDGQVALQEMKDAADSGKPIEAVVVDEALPEQDSLDFCLQVKSDENLRDTLLILLCSIWDHRTQQFKEAGFDACLNKPLRRSHLYNAILNVAYEAADEDSKERLAMLLNTDDAGKREIRILVAEDNEINQEVASLIVDGLGYTCECVDNGRKALEAAINGTYSLILMDCQMPDMDGYEATRAIRDHEARTAAATNGTPQRIPIIALTAHAMKGDRDKCMGAGMDDYLSKPLEPELLEKALSKWIPKTEERTEPHLLDTPDRPSPA